MKNYYCFFRIGLFVLFASICSFSSGADLLNLHNKNISVSLGRAHKGAVESFKSADGIELASCLKETHLFELSFSKKAEKPGAPERERLTRDRFQ